VRKDVVNTMPDARIRLITSVPSEVPQPGRATANLSRILLFDGVSHHCDVKARLSERQPLAHGCMPLQEEFARWTTRTTSC
jgi:hypothetical protein